MRKRTYIIESIEVENFAAEGKCLTRHEGEVIFIEGSNVAPKDIVKLLVRKSKTKYSEGTVLEIIQKSPDRIDPFCSHFGSCGGCKWQHVPYDLQLTLKAQQVADQLQRIGKVSLPPISPILASAETQFYRNKLEFSFSNSRWLTRTEIESGEEFSKNALGFHVPKRFDKVFSIEKCYLQAEPSNPIRNSIRAFADARNWVYYDHVEHVGFLRSMMIRTTSTGEVMLMIQFAQPDYEKIEELLNFLKVEFPAITSLNYIINQKRNDTFFDLEVNTFSGLPYITEQMEGLDGKPLQFRIGVKSFYQTNSKQAFELYKITRNFADLSGNELVYDLYTGTGTIANFVARQAKKVVGIEFVPDAIEDAKINSMINGIENTVFYAGDMKKLLTSEFIDANGRPDVIITDPPRAGMDEPVIETILSVAPDKIVYVSCNAATQARDLALLDGSYEVVAVQPVDMFPHTHHVENVVKLVRRK